MQTNENYIQELNKNNYYAQSGSTQFFFLAKSLQFRTVSSQKTYTYIFLYTL